MFVIVSLYKNEDGYQPIWRGTKQYPTERGAKIAQSALRRKNCYEHTIMTTNEYDAQVPMVTRRNLMSGRQYQERADTPNYCSPASEAYWSA